MLKKLCACVFFPNANTWFQNLLDRRVMEKTKKWSSCDRSSKFCSLSAISSWQKRIFWLPGFEKTPGGHHFERWTVFFIIFPSPMGPISSFLLLYGDFMGKPNTEGCFIPMTSTKGFCFLWRKGKTASGWSSQTRTCDWVSQENPQHFQSYTPQVSTSNMANCYCPI